MWKQILTTNFFTVLDFQCHLPYLTPLIKSALPPYVSENPSISASMSLTYRYILQKQSSNPNVPFICCLNFYFSFNLL